MQAIFCPDLFTGYPQAYPMRDERYSTAGSSFDLRLLSVSSDPPGSSGYAAWGVSEASHRLCRVLRMRPAGLRWMDGLRPGLLLITLPCLAAS